MSEFNKIETFVCKAKKRENIHYILEDLFGTILFSISAFLFFSLLNYIYPLQIFRFACIIVIVSLFVLFLFNVLRFLSRKKEITIFELQNKFKFLKDDLINVWQIGKTGRKYGTSEQIFQKFVESVNEKLKKINIKTFTDFNSITKKYIPLFLILLPLTIIFFYNKLDVIYNFTHQDLSLEKYFKIYPKNVKLPFASPVEITAKPLRPSLTPPTINLEINDRLHRTKMQKRGGEYVYKISKLINKIKYRLSWRGLKSQKFVISPLMSPMLSDFTITYFFPSYTSLKKKHSRKFGEVVCLPGTRVVFSATSNKILSSASLLNKLGNKFPLNIEGKSVTGKFTVEKETEWWFELESPDGTKNTKPVRYKIDVRKDSHPKVKLLSPAQNLIISQNQRLELLYEVSDDFGISKVSLIYKYGSEEVSIEMPFPKDKKEFIQDYAWDIITTGIEPGEKLAYYIRVWDNDTINGPKYSDTLEYQLTIFSYENEKKEIEENFKMIRQQLLRILGDEIMLTDTIEKEKFREAIEKQKRINKTCEGVLKDFKENLEKMSKNPLYEYQTMLEYENIFKGLQHLKNNEMKNILTPLNERKKEESSQLLEEIIAALEQITNTSQEVYKYQKMRELINSAELLSELAEKMKDKMGSLMTKESLEKIQKMFKEAEKLFRKIAELLTKLTAEELPEEFINQPSMKQIDISKAADYLNKAMENLRMGDLNAALNNLKNFLNQLKSLTKSLSQAFEGMRLEMKRMNLIKSLQEHVKKIDEILSEQKKVMDETEEIEKKRQTRLIDYQEELLKKLAEKQKKLIEKVHRLRGSQTKYKELQKSTRYLFPQTVWRMDKVYRELNSQKLKDSKKLLREVISNLKNIRRHQEKFMVKVSTKEIMDLEKLTSETRSVEEGEEEILNELMGVPPMLFSEDEKSKIDEIAASQNKIIKQTSQLGKSLKSFSKKTALLPLDIPLNLYKATKSMQGAKKFLSKKITNKAIDKQITSIQYLQKSKEGLLKTLSQIKGSQAKMLKPVAAKMQIYGREGRYGTRLGYVEIPGKEDFIPSKKFKEEILKSLKEKYPKEYEKIIKEYFEKIVK